jgi:hypothetical protein
MVARPAPVEPKLKEAFAANIATPTVLQLCSSGFLGGFRIYPVQKQRAATPTVTGNSPHSSRRSSSAGAMNDSTNAGKTARTVRRSSPGMVKRGCGQSLSRLFINTSIYGLSYPYLRENEQVFFPPCLPVELLEIGDVFHAALAAV